MYESLRALTFQCEIARVRATRFRQGDRWIAHTLKQTVHADLVSQVHDGRLPSDRNCVIGFEFVHDVLQDGMHHRAEDITITGKAPEHPTAEPPKNFLVLLH